MSTGLSTAFIEPLEATSIHATIMQVTHFLENYFKKDMPFECEYLQDQYNSEMGQMWDNIRDFIVYHYISPRKDTEFWEESGRPERWSTRLTKQMSIWKYRMPRTVDYINDIGNNFYSIGNTLWYQIAIGMNLLDSKIAKKELNEYGLSDVTKQLHKKVDNEVTKIMPDCMTTNKYYKSL